MRGEMHGYAYHHWASHVTAALAGTAAVVPLDDQTAYLEYPQYRWMFNKILLSEAQGLPAYPHGVEPAEVGHTGAFFSKPILNLWGLSTGAQALKAWSLDAYRPGHFWMPVLPEPQLSTDVVVERGRVLWSCTLTPTTDEHGSFVRWDVVPLPPEVEDSIGEWVARRLADHRGVANLETRGSWVMEAPPRMAVQFLDFYGTGWLSSIAAFYDGGGWDPPGPPSATGTSLVVRLPAREGGRRLRLTDRARLVELEEQTGATVYLPWQDGQRLCDANDDGHSYRVAIVNAQDVDDCMRLAESLPHCLHGLPEEWPPASCLSAREHSVA